MMLQGVLYVFLCSTCLPLCPNPCKATVPFFKSEETNFCVPTGLLLL